MSRWRAVTGSGRRAAAAVLCAVLAAAMPLGAAAAEVSGTSEGRDAAADVIAEASGGEYGEQVVSSAGQTLSEEQTVQVAGTFRDLVEGVLIEKAAKEEVNKEQQAKAGGYHFSGAGRSSVQIRKALDLLTAYMMEAGERVEEADGYFFTRKGTGGSGDSWSISYMPDDMQLRFVYTVTGENCTAMMRLSYDMDKLTTGGAGLAVWGVVDGTQYAAAWEAPFHRVLSTRTDDLALQELYSNFAAGKEQEYIPVLNVLSAAAFDCWQEALTQEQENGLGEIGFGAFDTYGWIRNADGKWMYLYKDGTCAVGSWKEFSGKWFHFDQDGFMETGWIEEGGKKYYCGENGVMVTGTVTIGTQEYTFDENGVLIQ